MPNTTISTRGESFLINDRLVYSEIEHSNPNAHGLLMNARFIQGIFDDRSNRARYARWGRDSFDPDEHTDNLIAALPEWRAHGLRAFTVGIQGGGPCFTIANRSAIDNNPFGEDGASFDDAYARRLDKLIRASDALGIVVIVSYFYVSQSPKLRNGKAVRNAVTVASNWLRDGGYANVMIEVANEYNIQGFNHPIIHEPEGMSALIDLARDESGGMLVGCSGGGGHLNREVAEASDIILIHGNGCSRQRFHNMIGEARGWGFNRPIICNEDSQALGNLGVAARNFASWGYYRPPIGASLRAKTRTSRDAWRRRWASNSIRCR
ncbi:MAG: hypothetical protein O3A46_14795 [Candidatus Poribacteria bacterium]|nr:hypothetical protein [Candidatus Poribacteria bacterium]